MKYAQVNGERLLFLTTTECVEAGIKEQTIKIAKFRNSNSWLIIKDPEDLRVTLVGYEKLTDRYKEMVKVRYGNPYDAVARLPILNLLESDNEAERFYLQYRYAGESKLPIKRIRQYTRAACWLNLLKKVDESANKIIKAIGVNAFEFFKHVETLMQREQKNGAIENYEGVDQLPAKFPTSYRKLVCGSASKLQQYINNGYACIIDKMYGNQLAAKIDDQVAESVLLDLVRRFGISDPMSCRAYNKWAVENGKKQITPGAVKVFRKKNRAYIHADKYGLKENYNVYGKHIQRHRPTAPLLLVEHDDNELDLFFQSIRKNNGRTEVYYFNRFVLCVVIDAYNDYPLGWAIAPTYTKELIRFAYLDAAYHIKELTGGWYLPHQIRSDRFGLDANLDNDLAKFYQSLGTYTPAAVKVARGKYIERSFGTVWHNVLACYPNYAGANVTSNRRVPGEIVDLNKKDYPASDKAPQQAAHFINILRHLVDDSTGLSRQEQWVKAFNESDKSKAHLIDEMQMMIKLGQPHDHQNKITNRGITPAINCVERTYEIPEELYLQTIGKKVQVIYDVMDYSRILVTDNQNLLFIARQVELMPAAIADMKPGDRAKINDRLEEKQRHMQMVAAKKKHAEDVLRLNGIETSGLLQAGIHSKAINHQALLDWNSGPMEALPKQKKPKTDAAIDPLDLM